MPSIFSNNEYADMVFVYGFCDGNATAARREYAVRFAHRRLPAKETFSTTFSRLRQTGSFGIPTYADGHFAPLQDEVRSNTILNHFDENPSTSVRRSSYELGISSSSIWRTLRADGRHAYHIQRVQHLLPQDMGCRRVFCDWMLSQADNDDQFTQKVMWTDEATFTRRGILNQRNNHIWSYENPRAVREHSFQHEFQCNVWLGVLDNTIVGPYFLPHRLNADMFTEFLENGFQDLLEDVPLNTRMNSWFQLDGCPAHFGRGPREWLNINYPRRWIGRGGPAAWPARSPDLTPMDYFVWGAVKQKVYEVPVDTLEDLRQRIVQACRELTPIQCRSATTSIIRRCRACLQSGGAHFEQNIF